MPVALLFISQAIITTLPQAAYAAPTEQGQTHTNEDVVTSWVAEPKGRGTFGILEICLTTLFICVWSAMHVGVHPNASKAWRAFYKLKWVVIGMFFPEALVVAAIIDYHDARRFRKEWEKRSQKRRESTEGVLDETMGFFVCMGGFSVGKVEGFSQFSNILTPNGLMFLIENGLATPGIFRGASVDDKNKADIFVKGMVFFKIIWMMVQCFVRVAFGRLPVTTLESHVVVHVFYTIFAYGVWWNKPLDISDPIPVVTDPELATLIVVLLSAYSFKGLSCLKITRLPPTGHANISEWPTSSSSSIEIYVRGSSPSRRQVSGTFDKIKFYADDKAVPETVMKMKTQEAAAAEDSMKAQAASRGTDIEAVTGGLEPKTCRGGMAAEEIQESGTGRGDTACAGVRSWFLHLFNNSGPRPQVLSLLPIEDLSVGGGLYISLRRSAIGLKVESESIEPTRAAEKIDVVLGAQDISNLETAAGAIASQKYLSVIAAIENYNENAYDQRTPLLIPRAEMHSVREFGPNSQKPESTPQISVVSWLVTPLVMVVFSALYGALHATYWNRAFPTESELLLWRLSSVTVAVTPLVLVLFQQVRLLMTSQRRKGQLETGSGSGGARVGGAAPETRSRSRFNTSLGGVIAAVGRAICTIFVMSLFFVLVLGRSFLVLEAFISLRSLPSTAFRKPF